MFVSELHRFSPIKSQNCSKCSSILCSTFWNVSNKNRNFSFQILHDFRRTSRWVWLNLLGIFQMIYKMRNYTATTWSSAAFFRKIWIFGTPQLQKLKNSSLARFSIRGHASGCQKSHVHPRRTGFGTQGLQTWRRWLPDHLDESLPSSKALRISPHTPFLRRSSGSVHTS